MDVQTVVVIGVGAVAVCSYVGTKLMITFPGARAWLQNIMLKGYAYLDKHKDEVPEEGKAAWNAAYEFLDVSLQSIADGKLTWGETKAVGREAIILINEVRKFID